MYKFHFSTVELLDSVGAQLQDIARHGGRANYCSPRRPRVGTRLRGRAPAERGLRREPRERQHRLFSLHRLVCLRRTRSVKSTLSIPCPRCLITSKNSCTSIDGPSMEAWGHDSYSESTFAPLTHSASQLSHLAKQLLSEFWWKSTLMVGHSTCKTCLTS